MGRLKAIKVSEETYAALNEIAGELQAKMKRPVSIDEAMKYLIKKREKGNKITDLAGTWDISDRELEQIKASLKEAWKKWAPMEQ